MSSATLYDDHYRYKLKVNVHARRQIYSHEYNIDTDMIDYNDQEEINIYNDSQDVNKNDFKSNPVCDDNNIINKIKLPKEVWEILDTEGIRLWYQMIPHNKVIIMSM